MNFSIILCMYCDSHEKHIINLNGIFLNLTIDADLLGFELFQRNATYVQISSFFIACIIQLDVFLHAKLTPTSTYINIG